MAHRPQGHGPSATPLHIRLLRLAGWEKILHNLCGCRAHGGPDGFEVSEGFERKTTHEHHGQLI